MTVKKNEKKAKRKVLTPQEKEQNQQLKEIRSLLHNIGFIKFPKVDGKEFVYDKRTSELDDMFYYENVILIMEYTIGNPSDHLLKKNYIYEKINNNPIAFIDFLLNHDKFTSLAEVFKTNILSKYTKSQLQVRIVYASKQKIAEEHKNLVPNVFFFDYAIVKYFEAIAKVIKRSTRFEFFHFLNINLEKVGDNILRSSLTPAERFVGHILPESHSSFKPGYKVVTFYMDANSLLQRAYVLRNDSWRDYDSVELYQRLLIPKKIREMRKYLHENNSVFVNNIIATLPVKDVKLYNESDTPLSLDASGMFTNSSETKVQPTKIEINNQANIIGIIDGQHRTYAYHEGNDTYEASIARLRKIQNLLVTGILCPEQDSRESKLRFEAKLFLEINANQSGASSSLKQTIENILNPYSTTAIAKYIINRLNELSPMLDKFERHWYEKDKIKTASIISFGLKPLIKLSGNDSLFSLWSHPDKIQLSEKKENDALLQEYKEFCVTQVRAILCGLAANVPKEDWSMSKRGSTAILNVTTINGVINCLRLLIQEGKTLDVDGYIQQFKSISSFNFKTYKSSQYNRLGKDLYEHCF